ncbi:hypothetical protein HDU67_007401 [Dinochytrium kinnereticum]|nr:hypothetical protein HDU67_007401 [Dinochytrium kinnereticum]
MASTASPQERYTPTVQERGAIDRANRAFLAPYIAGIIAGVSAGVGLTRFRKIQLNTWPGGLTVFATSITGEFVGRKVGEVRARNALQSYLPAESKLRELLESKTTGFRLNKPIPNQRATHDFSLEGSIPPAQDVMSSTTTTTTTPHPQTQRASPTAPQDSAQGSTWQSIRQRNAGPASTWDRLRSDAVRQQQSGQDEDEAEVPPVVPRVVVPRTREEEEEQLARTGVRRNQYGDTIQ